MTDLAFVKGHGTANDFVVVEYREDIEFTPTLVAAICDRRTGIGADGILIVTPSSAQSEVTTDARWFMDYRNADGSVAEMCGNGARVFAHYLCETGLEDSEKFLIATRGGDRAAQIEANGNVRIAMGVPATSTEAVLIEYLGLSLPADAWWIPNPHAVAFVPSVGELPVPLTAPVVNAAVFPDGQNVEFITDLTVAGGPLHAAMRVYERGVGETKSCGTGVCAASLSMRRRYEIATPGTTLIDVPGGRLSVEHHADGQLDLIGPAVLVAEGHFRQSWWEGER